MPEGLTTLAAYPDAIKRGDVLDLYGYGWLDVTKVGTAGDDGTVPVTVKTLDEPVQLEASAYVTIYRATDQLDDDERAAAESGVPLGTDPNAPAPETDESADESASAE